MITAAAFLIMLDGSRGPLGGDDFADEATPLAEEIARVQTAGLGEPSSLLGLAYGGGEQWILKKTVTLSVGPLEIIVDNPPGLPRDSLPRFMGFFQTHGGAVRRMLDEDLPDTVTTMEVEGVAFEVKTWIRNFPGYGEVSYSQGRPNRVG